MAALPAWRPPASFISILAATSDDIRKRAFRIMDSGYLDGWLHSVHRTEKRREGERPREGEHKERERGSFAQLRTS